MPSKQKTNYLEWFKKADEDMLNAKSILVHRDGTPGGVCFFCHQTAEKYLKGLLIFYDKDFSKVHDLLQLGTILLDIIPNIPIRNELELLNRYYIETRYPGDYPEFSWQEAEEAFESATKIKEFILKKTKS